MNRERKACRAKYFQAKVEHLKECKPSAWGNEIKTSATQQPALVVSNESVYRKLMKLNTSKAHGPDGIPG